MEKLGILKKNGIYSRIRHPMYFSFILWLFGYALFMGAVASLIIAIPLTVNIQYWRLL
jgi:protein-S-isoprenylcysteine O-methyltransferase Ste14